MKIHELKTWKQYFVAVFSGLKNFEIRFNDRDFKVGDEVLLKEYDEKEGVYTGRILHRRIDYILHGGQFGLQEGFVILGLNKI